jgi:hypothetical protein
MRSTRLQAVGRQREFRSTVSQVLNLRWPQGPGPSARGIDAHDADETMGVRIRSGRKSTPSTMAKTVAPNAIDSAIAPIDVAAKAGDRRSVRNAARMAGYPSTVRR